MEAHIEKEPPDADQEEKPSVIAQAGATHPQNVLP
jgi:hypothetical protein